jgi:hypothetical protein
VIRSRKYLNAAKGQACVNCGVRDGTVVAAHYTGLRQIALGKGKGHKCHDIAVADLCSKCHTAFDKLEAGFQQYDDVTHPYIKKIDNSEEFLFRVLLTIIRRLEQGELKFK